jgi:small subunit ribosomal protein S18
LIKRRFRGHRKKTFFKKKLCRFCTNNELQATHKDLNSLRYFITERGKIIPRRISGNCAKHQRYVARIIKRARVIAVAPFTASTI